jgi:hypothetical protein
MPENRIVWHIRQIERHGIRNLKFRDFYIDLICDKRASLKSPCKITIDSGGAFDLIIVKDGMRVEKKISSGHNEYEIK